MFDLSMLMANKHCYVTVMHSFIIDFNRSTAPMAFKNWNLSAPVTSLNALTYRSKDAYISDRTH